MDTLLFLFGLVLIAIGGMGLALARARPAEAGWRCWAAGFVFLGFRTWWEIMAFGWDLPATTGLRLLGVGALVALAGAVLRGRTLVQRVVLVLLVVASGLLAIERPETHPWLALFAALLAWPWSRSTGVRNTGRTVRWLDAVTLGLIASSLVLEDAVVRMLDLGGSTGYGPLVQALWAGARLLAAWWWLQRLWVIYRDSAWKTFGGVTDPGSPGGAIPSGRWHAWSLLAALLTMAGVGGLLRMGFNAQGERELVKAVTLIAPGLEGERVAGLAGMPSEIESASYIRLRGTLRAARANIAGARFMYVAGIRDGTLVYLVDAEAPDSAAFTPPGTTVESGDTRLWLQVMETRSPIFSPPYRRSVLSLRITF
jgi:hypothetical protein